ncbi:MAG: hypothetical protein ABFD91_08445 [Anaerohalosphaeraceae bacterium]
MKAGYITVLSLIVIGGCIETSKEKISIGLSEQQVKNELGIPDFISESSGDQVRTYKGNVSPKYKWPDDAIKKYYYMNTSKEYIFKNNHLLEVRDISEERRERLLKIK